MQGSSTRSPQKEQVTWRCRRIVVGVTSPDSIKKDLRVAADLVRISGGSVAAVHSVPAPPTSPLLSNIPFSPDARV